MSSTSNNVKQLGSYLAIAVSCGIFSFIYERFSHQVYSNYMVYLFAVPLTLGVLPQLLYLLKPKLNVGNSVQRLAQGFAVATLTTGSLLQGMLEIYGTTSPFIKFYLFAGIGMLAVSGMLWLSRLFRIVL